MELEAECFSFPETLTDAEKELFGYVNDGYFDFNPDTRRNNIQKLCGSIL